MEVEGTEWKAPNKVDGMKEGPLAGDGPMIDVIT